VDRCALFVDAGYVLADGAMAAHGTSHRESVAWDYAGLLQFFAGMAADRTGLQLLRCYWYEASVDGRRTSEHDTLADLPGLKLRLGRMRPGKREGVETEIHRDLTTLARNRAISDVLLVSAEEDLAQVIADVQDLGIRVTIVHISVDGNWTVSRSLRQQCDDIVEIHGAQLRPYAELVPATETARYNEQYAASVYGGRPLSNGHSASAGGGSHQALSAGSSGTHPAPPAIYTAPVVAEYQPPAPSTPRRQSSPQQPEPAPAIDTGPADPKPRGLHESHAADSLPPSTPQGPPSRPTPPRSLPPASPRSLPSASPRSLPPASPRSLPPASPRSLPPASPGSQSPLGQPGQSRYPAPATASFREPAPQAPPPMTAPPPTPDVSAAQGPPGPAAASPPAPSGQRAAAPRPSYEPSHPGTFADAAGAQFSPAPLPPAPPDPFSSAPESLPTRRGLPARGSPSHSSPSHSSPSHSSAGHSSQAYGPQGQRGPQPPRPQQAPRGQQAQRPVSAPGTGSYVPQQGPYSAALPGPSAGSSAGAASLTGTVQSAHAEGLEFGESVARDAPALWLEAVLARKPRMPTDLEARLLQGSALPIDSLLHDEVRLALRRGFWDALERSRR